MALFIVQGGTFLVLIPLGVPFHQLLPLDGSIRGVGRVVLVEAHLSKGVSVDVTKVFSDLSCLLSASADVPRSFSPYLERGSVWGLGVARHLCFRFGESGSLVLLLPTFIGSLADCCDRLRPLLYAGVWVRELDSHLSVKFSPICGVGGMTGVCDWLREVVGPLGLMGVLGDAAGVGLGQVLLKVL